MKRCLAILGNILYVCTFIFMFGGGLYTLAICISIVKEVFGSVVSYLSLIVFPILLVIAPWYALLAWGNWFPLAIVYGIWISVGILFSLAKLLTGEEI